MAEALPPARVDGEPTRGLPLDDRGLAYGDGLFETVLLFRGRAVWWQAHLERLAAGAAALGIRPPEPLLWERDLAELLMAVPAPLPARLVLKLILTRGSGPRGYAADPLAPPRWISQLLPLPMEPGHWRSKGLRLRWCDLRLAVQPRLAGHKHLNRLEQVLARAEWSDPAIDEGLLCDSEGALVSAVAANLFLARDGRLLTPRLERAGVAGTCRRFLLDGAEEAALSRADLLAADEVFLCNSLRGILPVTRLDDRHWPIGPLTRDRIARLAAADSAFDFESPP